MTELNAALIEQETVAARSVLNYDENRDETFMRQFCIEVSLLVFEVLDRLNSNYRAGPLSSDGLIACWAHWVVWKLVCRVNRQH